MFESMEDKGQVMSNLKSLRGVEKFIGISISIDLTREERKFIKGLSEEASRLNNARKEQEKSSIKYVVRGNREKSWKIAAVKIDDNTSSLG